SPAPGDTVDSCLSLFDEETAAGDDSLSDRASGGMVLPKQKHSFGMSRAMPPAPPAPGSLPPPPAAGEPESFLDQLLEATKPGKTEEAARSGSGIKDFLEIVQVSSFRPILETLLERMRNTATDAGSRLALLRSLNELLRPLLNVADVWSRTSEPVP